MILTSSDMVELLGYEKEVRVGMMVDRGDR